MFYLRRISERGLEMNFELGDKYNLVDNLTNPSDFEMLVKEQKLSTEEKLYGFVVADYGHKIIPIYEGQRNYIMTEQGNTFANLTRSYQYNHDGEHTDDVNEITHEYTHCH